MPALPQTSLALIGNIDIGYKMTPDTLKQQTILGAVTDAENERGIMPQFT